MGALPVGQSQWPAQGFADNGHLPQAGQGYHFPPPEAEPNYGYDQQVLAPQQWGQQGDPRAYEAANYLPVGGQPYAATDPGPFQQQAHYHQQAHVETDADYSDEYPEDEEPRRGRRWIFIVAALVGAIGVGGALAYTYRSLIAPSSGRVPLYQADPNVKVKPAQPGGKEFAGTDRKLPNRLGEGAVPPKAPEPEAQDAGEEKNLGPRPVKTVQIGSPVTVPGITLENRPPRAEPPQTAPKVAAQPPRRVTIGEPPPAQVEEEPPPPPARKVAAHSPPVVAKAPPTKLREAPAAASAGVGYVAVLSSQKTHIDAIKAYADVAEKHPAVLSGKTPDVQAAGLGERGIWYRAVVGPPGSREAAVGVCNQLKTAGHADCWVKPY